MSTSKERLVYPTPPEQLYNNYDEPADWGLGTVNTLV